MAIKAARAFTGPPKIAKVEGAYHSSYDYAEVSLDTKPEYFRHGPPPSAQLPPVQKIDFRLTPTWLEIKSPPCWTR